MTSASINLFYNVMKLSVKSNFHIPAGPFVTVALDAPAVGG